jgi:hypothetical protein
VFFQHAKEIFFNPEKRRNIMQKIGVFIIGGILLSVFSACTQHKIEVAPVEIKPIHITIDINVKIDKALDDFFGDIDETADSIGN